MVVSGYSGGFVDNPSYQAVCTGKTGHAEVTQITYDPSRISYEQLLEAFGRPTIRRPGTARGTISGRNTGP